MKAKRKYTESGLSAEEFVRVWQGADTLVEVVDKSGLGRRSATARAAAYRKHGIPLQKFPPGSSLPRLDVKALTALAKSLAKNGK